MPPFATRGVFTIAGLVALLQCTATAFGTGYWFDEVHAGHRPVPPGLGLRRPTAADACGRRACRRRRTRVVDRVEVAYRGCDRRAQVFTAAAQATGLWTTLAGHWLTAYALEPLQWMLLVWLVIRCQRVRDDRLLIVLGVLIGIAAMTKFQVMLLCLVLLVVVAINGPRDVFRRPLLWAGAALAAVIAMPTLIWQHLHSWPQLRMTPVVAGEVEAPAPQRDRTVIIGEDMHAFVPTGQRAPWDSLWRG